MKKKYYLVIVVLSLIIYGLIMDPVYGVNSSNSNLTKGDGNLDEEPLSNKTSNYSVPGFGLLGGLILLLMRWTIVKRT